MEAALSFADRHADDFSGFADDWVLWICELGADVFVEAGGFALAFAGVHLADCAGFAAGAALGGVYVGPDGAKVDDRGVGFACGGTWEWDLGIRLRLRQLWDSARF